jgi:hypothetical protein
LASLDEIGLDVKEAALLYLRVLPGDLASIETPRF